MSLLILRNFRGVELVTDVIESFFLVYIREIFINILIFSHGRVILGTIVVDHFQLRVITFIRIMCERGRGDIF